MWDLTTRVHKIFVLFVEFHVVSQSSRNKDVKKLKGKKNKQTFYIIKRETYMNMSWENVMCLVSVI